MNNIIASIILGIAIVSAAFIISLNGRYQWNEGFTTDTRTGETVYDLESIKGIKGR